MNERDALEINATDVIKIVLRSKASFLTHQRKLTPWSSTTEILQRQHKKINNETHTAHKYHHVPNNYTSQHSKVAFVLVRVKGGACWSWNRQEAGYK